MDLAVVYGHLGTRRRRMLRYLIEHAELDEPENVGDLVFHCGTDGRVTFEAVARRRGDIALLDEVS